MEFLRRNFKFIFIFIFAFFSMSFFLTYFDGDVLWNYGFSYAISRGEIPYLDFNMILTPFYPMLMSLILKVNSNIFFFYLENAFLIVAIFYFLFKMFDYKAWFFLILLIFPLPVVVFPSYNLFLIFLFILIIYCEKEKKSDYLIGFLIGLAILTKQTVGCALILPSIVFYYKDCKKLGERFIGLLLPCLIFLIYLLFTKSFYQFIDLCFLGLFDFTSKNKTQLSFSFVVGMFLIIISFYLFLRHKKEINYLYVLCFSMIIVPLFDYPHIEYFFFVFSLILIDKIKISKKSLVFNTVLFSLSCVFISFFFTTYQGKITYPNHYNNFNYRLLYNKNQEDYIRDRLINYINKNKDKKIVILASNAYFYKITCNLEITSFDLINKGNHGYNGTNKVKDYLSKLKKGTILIIDSNEIFSKRQAQFDKNIAKYGMKIGKKITSIGGYIIYEKI